MNDELIYTENVEDKGPIIYVFQLIEFILIGIYFLLFLKSMSLDSSAYISMITPAVAFIILIYQLVRILLEYKRKLITGPGIALKLVLFIFTTMIFMAMWMKSVEHPLANLISTSALFSMAFFYPFYALALEKITFKSKVILTINAICISVLSMGILMSILGHPLYNGMLKVGLAMACVSLISFIIIRNGITKKGKYHSVNYFARSLLFVIAGINYII